MVSGIINRILLPPLRLCFPSVTDAIESATSGAEAAAKFEIEIHDDTRMWLLTPLCPCWPDTPSSSTSTSSRLTAANR